MNPVLVYLLLLKATLTTFSGLAGLPIVRQDFVVDHHAISDEQLNQAIAIGRAVPGPNGLYVVCVGYSAGGAGGAIAGFLAMVTPAFLIIPLLYWLARYTGSGVVRRTIRAMLLASAALLVSTTVELARSTIHDGISAGIALASAALIGFSPIGTAWVMLGAGLLGYLSRGRT